MTGFAKAVAHSNIALAKYWGKADTLRNLTAVPSLSLTLAAMRTITGLDGRVLGDEWHRGVQAYKSVNVSGYPNLFFTFGPNSGPGRRALPGWWWTGSW